jgi:hypothetical protein
MPLWVIGLLTASLAWIEMLSLAPWHLLLCGVVLWFATGRERAKPAMVLQALVMSVIGAAIAASSYVRHLIFGADLYEDGPRLASANAWLGDLSAYRDFVLQYGPLQEIVRPLLAFRVHSPTYEAYVLSGHWISALTAAVVFLLTARAGRRFGLALFIGLIALIRPDWWFPDRVFFAALSVWLGVFALDEKKPWAAFLSGVFAVSTWLYSAEIGIALAIGFVGFLGLDEWARRLTSEKHGEERRRLFSAFAFGNAAALLLFLLFLVLQGGVSSFFSDLFARIRYGMGGWSEGLASRLFAAFFKRSAEGFAAFAYINALPFVSVGVAAYEMLRARRQNEPIRPAAFLLASVGFFQFFVYIGRTDFIHWRNASTFFWPLLALVISEGLTLCEGRRGADTQKRLQTVAFATVLIIPCLAALMAQRSLLAFASAAPGLFKPPVAPGSAVSAQILADARLPRLGRVWMGHAELTLLTTLRNWIERDVPAGERFFDFSNRPAFYFLFDRQSPTRFTTLDAICGPTLRERALRDLASKPPAAVLVIYDGATLRTREDLVALRDWILQNYQERERLGDFGWWVRKKR